MWLLRIYVKTQKDTITSFSECFWALNPRSLLGQPASLYVSHSSKGASSKRVKEKLSVRGGRIRRTSNEMENKTRGWSIVFLYFRLSPDCAKKMMMMAWINQMLLQAPAAFWLAINLYFWKVFKNVKKCLDNSFIGSVDWKGPTWKIWIVWEKRWNS